MSKRKKNELPEEEDLTVYWDDYQAEIDRRSAIDPNDPSIPTLQELRQEKIDYFLDLIARGETENAIIDAKTRNKLADLRKADLLITARTRAINEAEKAANAETEDDYLRRRRISAENMAAMGLAQSAGAAGGSGANLRVRKKTETDYQNALKRNRDEAEKKRKELRREQRQAAEEYKEKTQSLRRDNQLQKIVSYHKRTS